MHWSRRLRNMMQTLARISLFKSLPPEAIRRLDARCIWRRAKAGECVLDYSVPSPRLG